jgi:hypothetical protein
VAGQLDLSAQAGTVKSTDPLCTGGKQTSWHLQWRIRGTDGEDTYGICYGLTICAPPSLILTPNVMVFEDEDFSK